MGEGSLGCIEACYACAAACDACEEACLRESDVTSLASCIRLNLECAELCRFLARVLARGSTFAQEYVRLCANLCDACAVECEKHEHEHCRACARACRACAQECRKLLGNVSAATMPAALHA